MSDAPKPLQTESGEIITLKNANGEYVPCRRCGGCPATGMNFIRDGVSIFKHDVCGKKMNLGNTETVARQNKASIEGMNKADENRSRLYRDEDKKMEEEMKQKLEDPEERADVSSLEKGGFLWANFLG